MAELFARYESGTQLTAGDIVGSTTGVSGLNPMVDRLNSISTDDNLITGSVISGTSTIIDASNITTQYQDTNVWTGSVVSGTNTNIITKYQNANTWTGSLISGTNMTIYVSGGNALQTFNNIQNINYDKQELPGTGNDYAGSVVLVTRGGPVMITGYINLMGLSGASDINGTGVLHRFKRNGSLMSGVIYYSTINGEWQTDLTIPVSMYDTPSAGTNTYTLNNIFNGFTGSAEASITYTEIIT